MFVFNGSVRALLKDQALIPTQNEAVRIYVGNAGPNLISSFHIMRNCVIRVIDCARRRAMISRREFLATTGAAVAASSVGAAAAERNVTGAGVDDQSARVFRPDASLKSGTLDRLPRE